jgi:hypothetical protein
MSSSGDTGTPRWWVDRLEPEPDGTLNVGVRFDDGSAIQLVLEPLPDLDQVIADAVDAYLRKDRRWTRRSERGG